MSMLRRLKLPAIITSLAVAACSQPSSPITQTIPASSQTPAIKPMDCLTDLKPLAKAKQASSNTKTVIYVAQSGNNQVAAFTNVWNRKGGNYSYSITAGIAAPLGIWIDANGTLYVANSGNNTVTEYPERSGSPSLTISQGISQPWGVIVDAHGTVYVSNLVGYINEYPAGSTTPSATITGFSAPGQMAFDSEGNLFIADNSGTVDEVPFGQTKPINLGLKGLQSPYGIAFDSKGDMFVSNSGVIGPTNNVLVYFPGEQRPACTINMNGIGAPLGNPLMVALTRNGTLYVPVAESLLTFSPHGYVLRSITSDPSVMDFPFGVAIWEQKR